MFGVPRACPWVSPPRFSPAPGEPLDALRKVWEASDRLCSKRLKPFIGELTKVMLQHGELAVNASVEAELCHIIPSAIDRLLRLWRRLGGRRPLSITKPSSLLKRFIPIRTFADWTEEQPSFLEVNLVAHCGESTEGFYLRRRRVSSRASLSAYAPCLPLSFNSFSRLNSPGSNFRLLIHAWVTQAEV